MFLVKVELKPSPVDGLGCFAAEKIEKDQRVWIFDSRIDVRLPYESLSALPDAIQEFLGTYAYVEVVEGDKVLTLCGDFARHMNHATSPNVASVYVPGVNVATRDIDIGEELTCNYYAFDLEAAEKLAKPGR